MFPTWPGAPNLITSGAPQLVATKIKLMRLGKMREPHYRIVVADSRTKRDGRAIETIGEYHPKDDPSVIKVDSERAAYWLGVGAQPTEAVTAILKVTGDWQKFKGLPAPGADEGRRRRSRTSRRCSTPRWPRPSGEPSTAATTPRKRAADRRRRRAKAESADEAAADRRTRRREAEPGRGEPDVLEEALEHLVTGIVDHPDDVRVDMVDNRRGQRLEVRVHPDDLGRVIGRNGRTAKALRQVINGVGGKGIRVDVIDVDRR